MTRERTDSEIDWVEVGRESHELELRHGWNAHVYAAGLADKAEVAGDREAVRFWRAVYESVRPR